MKKLLGYLKGAGAAVAAAITVAVLIALFGPRIGLRRPWNYVVAGSIVLVTLLVWGIWWLLKRRRERRFETAIVEQGQADAARASVAKRAEMENLVTRWKDSIRALRESNLEGRNVLTVLPWFMILGEPQCGKSTLLRNSGLDFPLGDAAIQGLGGTRNCDWWFANEAIILDTAGRYAFEVQTAPDRAEWKKFLDLIRRTRKGSSINGLLVTVPVDTLLQREEEHLRAYAQRLRSKINDIMTSLESVFPVYLVVTKLDMVEGFVDFFANYPPNRVREALGRTFTDVRPKEALQEAGKTLDDLYDRLCSMSLGLMEDHDPGDEARSYLMFPEEYRSLADRLKVLIEALFRENIYMKNPVFRGFYLTSGTQEGRTISHVFDQMARNLKIDPESLTTEFAQDRPKRAFFVRDVLSTILIADSARDMVQPLVLGPRQQFVRALSRVILPAVAVSALVVAWSFLGYSASRDSWQGLRESIEAHRSLFERGAEPVPDGPEFAANVAALNELGAEYDRLQQAPRLARLFLVRSDPVPDSLAATLRAGIERAVVKPTLRKVGPVLEQGGVTSDEYVAVLASYLSYRRALLPNELVGQERFRDLARPQASRLGTFGAAPGESEALAASFARYLRLAGTWSGDVDLAKVSLGLRAIIRDAEERDPVQDLENSLRRAREDPSGSDDAAILSEILRSVGARGFETSSDLEQMARDLKTLELDSAVESDLVGRLEELIAYASGGSGESQGSGELDRLLGGPLREAVGLKPPECPQIDPRDPAGLAAFGTDLQDFFNEIENRAAEIRSGAQQFNEQQRKSLDTDTLIDSLKRGKSSELKDGCVGDWFRSGGALSSTRLRNEFVSQGEGGDTEDWVGPPGQGLFQCLVSRGGGASATIDQPAVDALEAAVEQIAGIREVPPGLRAHIRNEWIANKPGSSGSGGSARGALKNIELAVSPESWTLADAAEQLADTSLGNILSTIAGEWPDPAVNNTKSAADSYSSALGKIRGHLDDADRDRELGYVTLVTEELAASRGRGSFQRAFDTARDSGLPGLERVPAAVWQVLIQEARNQLEDYYAEEIREDANAMSKCYPFAEDGPDCDPALFNEVFGDDGTIGRLRDLGELIQKGSLTRYDREFTLGPLFQEFLGDSLRVFEYGSKGVEIRFSGEPAEIVPAEGIKESRLFFEVKSSTLKLADQDYEYQNESGWSKANHVMIEPDAPSRLAIELTESAIPGLAQKASIKENYTLEKVEIASQPSGSGPWSFLRLLENGAAGGACCSWSVDVVEKKKEKKVATVQVKYRLVDPSRLLKPGFWSLNAPPRSISE